MSPIAIAPMKASDKRLRLGGGNEGSPKHPLLSPAAPACSRANSPAQCLAALPLNIRCCAAACPASVFACAFLEDLGAPKKCLVPAEPELVGDKSDRSNMPGCHLEKRLKEALAPVVETWHVHWSLPFERRCGRKRQLEDAETDFLQPLPSIQEAKALLIAPKAVHRGLCKVSRCRGPPCTRQAVTAQMPALVG